jgi:hypothetical protein
VKLALIFLLPLVFVVFCTLRPMRAGRKASKPAEGDRRLAESENVRRLVLAPSYYVVITSFLYGFWVTGLDHPGTASFIANMIGWSSMLAIDAWGDRLPLVGERLAPAINEMRRARWNGFGKLSKPLVLEKL